MEKKNSSGLMDRYPSRNFEQVESFLASQWCGSGAVPGAGLQPTSVCGAGAGAPIRPLTIPGYGAGPHGFDTYTWGSMPNIASPWPLIANIPDRSVDLDPMDSRIWGPPSSDGQCSTDPYQPWTYTLGAWP